MAENAEWTRRLYYGDNINVLRESVPDASVDLVYLDPPFNSKASYNILFKSPQGRDSHAQIEAFEDNWHWGIKAEAEFDEIVRCSNTAVAEMVIALRRYLGQNDMMAYLVMMTNRLLELHRVLKPTGSLYLHCDPTASHYLKVVLDGVFGKNGFRSEISWKRSSAHSDAKQGRRQYGNIRDILFFYTKSEKWTWNWIYTKYAKKYMDGMYRHAEEETGRRYRKGDLTAARPGGDTLYKWHGVKPYHGRYWAYSKEKMEQFEKEGRLVYSKSGMPNYKRYLDEMPGVALQNDWQDIPPASRSEYLGYPTQKPLALLERIIQASSDEGALVLDPFCGCGTAVHAAEKLNRQWMGIDITHLAVSLVEKRLRDAFPEIGFEVEGTPKDLEGARDLARRDKYQFQWWACSLVNAQPYRGKKKGADTGIDGLIYFKDEPHTVKKIIVSVKGGESVHVAMVRDLGHIVEREKAQIGLFVTLAEPTGPMKKEAAAAGFYTSEAFGKNYPRIQILTVEDLLAGKDRPRFPDPTAGGLTFKKAKREKGKEKEGFLDFG
jgi:DNA modification methylase